MSLLAIPTPASPITPQSRDLVVRLPRPNYANALPAEATLDRLLVIQDEISRALAPATRKEVICLLEYLFSSGIPDPNGAEEMRALVDALADFPLDVGFRATERIRKAWRWRKPPLPGDFTKYCVHDRKLFKRKEVLLRVEAAIARRRRENPSQSDPDGLAKLREIRASMGKLPARVN